ncbi:MAG: Smr/MutS family protein [Verrucomicrobiota bacterium]
MNDDVPEQPVEIEITDELDLHTFQPREVSDLLEDYLGECLQRGLLNVRVIHGKGTGALRIGVHEKLGRMDIVEAITWPASADTGGWGATWVRLRRKLPSHSM